MQRRATFLAVCTLLAMVAGALPLSAQTGVIRCESRGNQRAQCPVDRNVQVSVSKNLSTTACRENYNWGVGAGFLWVTEGCGAEFNVSPGSYSSQTQLSPVVTELQLRACQSEADRRLPGYTYDQIRVVAAPRQGDEPRVRWSAGNASGMCTVSSTGRMLEFTMRDQGPGDGYDGHGGYGGGTSNITCESSNNDRMQCPIPRGARIRLVRQMSTSPCRDNDTFGTGDDFLWVTRGCRGEFEVVRVAIQPPIGAGRPIVRPEETTRVMCQSTGRAQRACPIPAGGTVRLVRQISTQPCRLGITYTVDASRIVVKNGCSAEFEVRSGGVIGGTPEGPGGQAQWVTCQSTDGKRSECRIRADAQVKLVRLLSTTPCTRNSSWGTGLGIIWVDKGCRGEFQVR